MNIKELLPEIKYHDTGNFFLIAGPCVVESEENCFTIAEEVAQLSEKYTIPYIFKASYKKANRSKLDSFAGIGDKEALEILKKIRNKYKIPVLTDIHTPEEAYFAAGYVDILQIPAFLCRQTDLLVAAAKTGKVVNIKKGQFLSPDSMRFALDKVVQSGNKKVMLTDRGTMFGYHDLIVDFRGIVEMKKFDCPVILDITHSLQQPNQPGGVSGGQPEMIETIARAGISVGVDGIFLETHPDPKKALSDGSNMIDLQHLDNLLIKLIMIRKTINQFK
ncbi:MAG: 3-deoxy-8-phosphooctulonate synthase [Bacteroidales bacterium]